MMEREIISVMEILLQNYEEKAERYFTESENFQVSHQTGGY